MRRHAALLLCVLLAAAAAAAQAQDPAEELKFDQSRSVYNRRMRPAEPPEKIDWEGRITALLRKEPGDVVITAVGDMIFNEQISQLPGAERQQLLRLLREADIAYGNLEFSINSRPELQRPMYNFRTPPEFVWEVADIGINLVSLANNHALDFGPEGLVETMKMLGRAGIRYAGGGKTLAEARAPATSRVQSRKTRFGLLSSMRFWTPRRCADPSGPCIATIDPGAILVAKEDGSTETVEGPLASDISAMEDDVVLAKRHHDVVMFALHNHDLSHHRAYGLQDRTPENDQVIYRRAIDAGADMVFGSGPHVLRGIEIRNGKPIFYSLSNFIYQYRTPGRIPVDLIHQRDGEIERPVDASVYDLRDPVRIFEGVVARITVNETRLKRIELIPFTIDDEGPHYGAPRLPGSRRAGEIVRLMQTLSEPYGTKIVDRGWYGEIQLEQRVTDKGTE